MKIKKHTITHAIKYIFLSLLLALPFIAMLPSTFYYAFNQNAQDNTANELITEQQYKTNALNSVNDLIEGNYYTLYSQDEGNTVVGIYKYYRDTPFYALLHLLNYTLYDEYDRSTIDETYINDYPINEIYTDIALEDNWRITFYNTYTTNKINNINYKITSISQSIQNGEGFEIIFMLNSEFHNYLTNEVNTDLVNNDIEEGMLREVENIDQYGGITYEIIEHDLNNQNAFYYASSQVFKKPLFNWVKNSIFVVPIMGMLGIFGISEMNFISSLLVYWVNILSIYAILNIILLVIEKLGSFGKRKNE